jgi:hypothetical protein
VLHGDCVLDTALGCTVLGGDTLMETLATELRPRRVVFLTDVEGVFTHPPHLPEARLIQVPALPLPLRSGRGAVREEGAKTKPSLNHPTRSPTR